MLAGIVALVAGAVPAQAETVKVGISKLLGYVGMPVAIMSSFTGLAAEQLSKAIPYVDRDGRIAAADIARQIAWYKAQNLLRGDVKAEELIDSRYAIPLLAAK